MTPSAKVAFDDTIERLIATTARTEANTVYLKGEVGQIKSNMEEQSTRIRRLEDISTEKKAIGTFTKWLIRIGWGLLTWMWGFIMADAPKIKALLHWLGW